MTTSMKITIQVIINFFALDRFLNPVVGSIIPINGLGVLFSFLYWFILLILSYQLALFLKK